jgi:hypothetical protein
MTPTDPETTGPLEWRPWAEFLCWNLLLLAPFLCWVDGSSVSTDQFVVRSAIVALAACGAVGLRSYALFHRS